MEFWIFVLAVWLAAEWLMRRRYQQKNDERFGNLVDGLNRVERELSDLKKAVAHVAQMERHPAAAVATPPPQEPRVSAILHGPAPTVPAVPPRVAAPPISPPSPAAPEPPPMPPPQAAQPVAPKPPAATAPPHV